MDANKSAASILLVSDDKFVLGLLQGYCLANQLELAERSYLHDIELETLGNAFQHILVDYRAKYELHRHHSFETLRILRQLVSEFEVPICAICDATSKTALSHDSGVNLFVEEPIMENLDRHLRVYFGHQFQATLDRREGDRRRVADRRASLTSATERLVRAQAKKRGVPCELGPFCIDAFCKTVALDGFDLGLTAKEFRLFALLATDINRIFAAEEIIQAVWPENSRANKSDLYQYMHLLRRKIEIDPDNPHWIITIKGIGYKLRLDAPVTKSPTLVFENRRAVPR